VGTLSKGGRHFSRRLILKALPADAISPQTLSSLIHHEKSVWYAACYCSRRMKHGDEETEDAVVNQMLDFSGVQYAVIAGPRTETGPERLVIAYPNEKSLRDFIAAASIIAVGFSSREEAIAGARRPSPMPSGFPWQ
jgi:hypothetical protein